MEIRYALDPSGASNFYSPAPGRTVVPINRVAVRAEGPTNLRPGPIGRHMAAPVHGATRALTAFVAQLKIPFPLPDIAGL